MQNNNMWTIFEATGNVEDYLYYKNINKIEEEKDIDKYLINKYNDTDSKPSIKS